MPAPSRSPSDRNILVEIYESLEEHDVDLDSNPLNQFVAVEALDRVVSSLDDDFEITFVVERIHVTDLRGESPVL